MAIGWIDEIYNNSTRAYALQSIDSSHNGSASKDLAPGELPPPVPWLWPRFDLDDKQFHTIPAKTHWSCQWCGVPWYWNSVHYKVLRSATGTVVKFYQSQVNGVNSIWFQDANTGRILAKQQVSKSSDYHLHLRFEDDGVYFDVINDDGTTADFIAQVNDTAKGWVTALAPIIAALLK